jgi:hypothetical protein
MKQNDHGGRGDDRESTVDPRCSGHPPPVVCEPVLDPTNGPCPSVLASAMCRRDDRQRPPNDRENSGDCARDSEHDHPKARPGSGLDVEVGDAHAKEAIGRARRSFQPGTPPGRGSLTDSRYGRRDPRMSSAVHTSITPDNNTAPPRMAAGVLSAPTTRKTPMTASGAPMSRPRRSEAPRGC